MEQAAEVRCVRSELVQTSDVVTADRGARVHEDVAVSMVDRDHLGDCPYPWRLLHKPIRNPVHQLVGGIAHADGPALAACTWESGSNMRGITALFSHHHWSSGYLNALCNSLPCEGAVKPDRDLGAIASSRSGTIARYACSSSAATASARVGPECRSSIIAEAPALVPAEELALARRPSCG
jgi:hypothetical protein